MIMEISVRGLQNYMINISDDSGLVSAVDSVTHEVLISDTTLR